MEGRGRKIRKGRYEEEGEEMKVWKDGGEDGMGKKVGGGR